MSGVIAHLLDFELFQSWDRKYGKHSEGADRNIFRAARALQSVKAVLHRVLLLFSPFQLCNVPKAARLPWAQWSEEPDSNILGT